LGKLVQGELPIRFAKVLHAILPLLCVFLPDVHTQAAGHKMTTTVWVAALPVRFKGQGDVV